MPVRVVTPAVTVDARDGGNYDLVVLGDGEDWPDSVPGAFYARPFANVAQGSSVGQWEPVPVTDGILAAVDAAVAEELGGYATEAYVDSAVTGLATSAAVATDIAAAVADLATEGYVDTAIATRSSVPGAPSTISLALNTARNPSAVRSDTRPTKVTVSGTWSWTLTAIGTATGTVQFKTDSNSNPTAVVIGMPFSRGIGVGLTVNDTGTIGWSMAFDVDAGDYYVIATSGVAGGGSFGTPLVVEQVI